MTSKILKTSGLCQQTFENQHDILPMSQNVSDWQTCSIWKSLFCSPPHLGELEGLGDAHGFGAMLTQILKKELGLKAGREHGRTFGELLANFWAHFFQISWEILEATKCF